MRESFSRPPLQVMRAIQDASGCAWVYLLSPTGGVVQGDRYSVSITVEAGAHALVTTLSASKVYRMTDDHAAQNVQIEVMPGAALEYIPDAAILFNNANLHQTINITLHEGAVLMFQDAVMAGRAAAGESVQFTRWKNQFRVCDPKGLLLYETQDVQPAANDITSMGILEGYRCWASWYLLGDTSRLGLDPKAYCERVGLALAESQTVLGSATRLLRGGVGVRLLGHYWSPVSAALVKLWQQIRTDYMGLPLADLRK